MASIVIVVIACSKSLYKASQKRRNKKRELAGFADSNSNKPSVRRRSATTQQHQTTRRPRRVPNTNSYNAAHSTTTMTYNSNSMVPRPGEPFDMAAAGDRADLESLTRASTIVSESGQGRRRMSDESTLAEVARDGAWTART